jgi:hypothetical protein
MFSIAIFTLRISRTRRILELTSYRLIVYCTTVCSPILGSDVQIPYHPELTGRAS